jgi:hypothetical protein
MYFDECKDKNELKAKYRKLAMKHHPDRGGDEEVMKAVNAAYEEALKRLAGADGKTESDKGEVHFDDLDDGFRDVLDKILNIDGLEIELCGSWLWISGATREHRKELKEAGCHWAPKKKMWYWRPEEMRCFTRSTGIKDMSYIRTMYGSDKIVRDEKKKKKRITA